MIVNKNKIVYGLQRALKLQFACYSWEDMIDDVADAEGWTDEERKWAKEHTTYEVKVDES